MPQDNGRLPTGIILLDYRLSGGVPPGSFVCVYGEPLAVPTAFLCYFASVDRSIYVTTNRLPEDIMREMKSYYLEPEKVVFVNFFSYYMNLKKNKSSDEEVFHAMDEVLEKMKNEKFPILVIDSLSFFLSRNVPLEMKEIFLNKLYLASRESEAVIYAYLAKNRHSQEIVSMVHEISDVVFDLSLERVGEKSVYRLSIPKFRGDTISEYLRFRIEDGIRIDTSRDIA